MHKIKLVVIPALLVLTGCTDTWSETAPDGTRYEDARPACEAKARASAEHQFRFNQTRLYLEGTNDTRQDIARRETALCLENKGFKLKRNF